MGQTSHINVQPEMSEDVQKDQGSEHLQLQKVQVLQGPKVC